MGARIFSVRQLATRIAKKPAGIFAFIVAAFAALTQFEHGSAMLTFIGQIWAYFEAHRLAAGAFLTAISVCSFFMAARSVKQENDEQLNVQLQTEEARDGLAKDLFAGTTSALTERLTAVETALQHLKDVNQNPNIGRIIASYEFQWHLLGLKNKLFHDFKNLSEMIEGISAIENVTDQHFKGIDRRLSDLESDLQSGHGRLDAFLGRPANLYISLDPAVVAEYRAPNEANLRHQNRINAWRRKCLIFDGLERRIQDALNALAGERNGKLQEIEIAQKPAI